MTLALPAGLRGYGHVKARNREVLLAARSQLMSKFRGETRYSEVIHQSAA